MENPEAWLRATTAPLAHAPGGQPIPGRATQRGGRGQRVRGARAAARGAGRGDPRRTADRAGGEQAFRVGREIGELSINPGAHIFQEARAAVLDSPRQIPLAVAAGPARLPLRRHDLAITWATLTPEGIRLCYRGGARNGDRDVARALVREITEDIAELSITDDDGGTCQVPAAKTCPAASPGSAPRQARRAGFPKGRSWPYPFAARPVRAAAVPPSGGWSSPRDPARRSGSRSRRPPRCRRVPRSRPGRPRRSATWTSSHHRITTQPDRLVGSWHGGTRHRGHRGRRRRRAGRRPRTAAGQRGAHGRHGPGAP